MKKNLLLRLILIAFLAVGITSCENEPLEGDFPIADTLSLDPGELKALRNGNDFSAQTASATISETGFFVLTAVDDASSNAIVLSAANIDTGSFNLAASGTSGNSAVYIRAIDVNNPYVSTTSLGGSGNMIITEYDTTNLTISGTFDFVGARIKLDFNGNPIIGADGNPVIEEVNFTNGAFNKVPYTIGGTGGGDPDPDPDPDPNPTDSFSAKVDGVFFSVDSLSVSRVVISDIPVIRIVAIDSLGAKIRVDVPELLGVGNHDMVQISNGTELIGLYNSNTGGENLTSNPGSINITEFNTVSGVLTASFQFTGTDPLNNDPTVVEVSMGQFTVNYEPDPMNPNTPFTCEIDGVFFNPGLNVTAIETIVEGNNVILISAISGTEQMEILFPSTLTTGTYAMSENISDGDEIVGYYRPDIGGATSFNSNPGELILTAIDLTTGQLEGTFTFTASDPTDVDPTVFEVTFGAFMLVIE